MPEFTPADAVEIVRKVKALQQKIEGTGALYQAALLENDGIEADKHRMAMHVFFDEILDTQAGLIARTRS
jgi:hypothetical protein